MKKTVILALVLLISSSSFSQQTITLPSAINKIEVTGSAEMEVVPDEIYIGITLQEYYKKPNDKVTIDQISKDFLAIAQKAGISKDRIEVMNMSGFDHTGWWHRKRKKEQPDLMQFTTYIIKFTQPAEVDQLVNQLDDNATQNIYVNKMSHSKQTEFRKDLKTKALQNAKDKAQYMLQGIGQKTGNVVFVREIEFNQPYPMYQEKMMANTMADGGGSANEGLNFKKIKYRYEVEAHFEIK